MKKDVMARNEAGFEGKGMPKPITLQFVRHTYRPKYEKGEKGVYLGILRPLLLGLGLSTTSGTGGRSRCSRSGRKAVGRGYEAGHVGLEECRGIGGGSCHGKVARPEGAGNGGGGAGGTEENALWLLLWWLAVHL